MTPKELKRLRGKLGVSQTEMAEILGVNAPGLSMWESGVRDVPDYIAKLVPLVVKEELAKRTKASA